MVLVGAMFNACKIYYYLKFCFWYDLQKSKNAKEKTKKIFFNKFDQKVWECMSKISKFI
jgi:hypothetical protein